MGPLLFIIYLNDFEKTCTPRRPIYTLVTQLSQSPQTVLKVIEDAHKELSNIAECMRVNKLSPNPQKTEFMIIGHPFKTRRPELPETLELNDSDVTKVDKRKYLEIIIDENLVWDEKFKRIRNKTSAGLVSLFCHKASSAMCTMVLLKIILRYSDIV